MLRQISPSRLVDHSLVLFSSKSSDSYFDAEVAQGSQSFAFFKDDSMDLLNFGKAVKTPLKIIDDFSSKQFVLSSRQSIDSDNQARNNKSLLKTSLPILKTPNRMKTVTNSTTAEQGRLPLSMSDPSLTKRVLAVERKQSSPNCLVVNQNRGIGNELKDIQIENRHLSLQQMKSAEENLEPEDNDSFLGLSNSDLSHQFIKKKIPEFNFTNYESENYEKNSNKPELKSLFNLHGEHPAVKWSYPFNHSPEKTHETTRELCRKFERLMVQSRNIFDIVHSKIFTKPKKTFCLSLFKSSNSSAKIVRERELHYLNFLKYLDESYSSLHRETCISLFNDLRQCASDMIRLSLKDQMPLELCQTAQNTPIRPVKSFRGFNSSLIRDINHLLSTKSIDALALIALFEFAQSNSELLPSICRHLSSSNICLWDAHYQVFQLAYECFVRRRQKIVKSPEHILGHLISFSSNCLMLATAQLSKYGRVTNVGTFFQMSVDYCHANFERLSRVFLQSDRYSLIQNLALLTLNYTAVARLVVAIIG